MIETKDKKRLILPYIILFAGISLFIFSNGRWCFSFAAWIAPVFLLHFIRYQKPLRGAFILFILIALTSRIMLYGIIPPWIGILEYLLTVYYAILWFLPYLVDRLFSKKLCGFIGTLVFPITGVAFEYINNLLFGSWASIAYTQFDNLTLIQISSIFGIWGITFIIMWFASVVNWVIDLKFQWLAIRKGVFIYAGTLSLLLLFGGLRLGVFPPQSHTVTVASFTPTEETEKYYNEELDKRGFGSSLEMAEKDRSAQSILLQRVYDEVFTKATRLINSDVSITFWPEALIKVLEEDENAFIISGRQWAETNNVYILMSYFVLPIDNPGRLGENKSVLINPSGKIEFTYIKAHPVPGSSDKAGNAILPVSNTPFGKISTAICYDMDFTALIKQAGKVGIDIMLVPAWDWEAIDPIHARMAVFRAVENGFSMVRQTGKGLSIAVDFQGRTLATMDHFRTDNHTMVSHIPMSGTKTVYSVIGDSFAWLCLFVFCISIGWSFFSSILLPIVSRLLRQFRNPFH